MLKTNKAKQTLKDGGVCFGTMLRLLHSPHAIPLCASAGWDFIIIDTEHGDFDSETLAGMCVAAKYEELALLARVPDKLYHQLAKPLDLGLEGLVIPRVEESAEVQHILQSTKYHPMGARGASVSTTATLFRDHDAVSYMEWANRETLIVVQVESQRAVENVDKIVSVSGVDAVLIGPFDLSQSMGIPGQTSHPRMADAFRRVIEACKRHHVAPGIHLSSIESAAQWVKAGMRFVTYSYDAKFLLDSSQEAVKQLRDIARHPKN
ncbi:MAG TPA: aldolase/citrate lyase family protein [Acidobacteriota bacterium]|jgi:4-hydroxy-2-oxoheptanedioate aldolase